MIFTSPGSNLGANKTRISHGCHCAARKDDTHAWLVREVVCRFRYVKERRYNVLQDSASDPGKCFKRCCAKFERKIECPSREKSHVIYTGRRTLATIHYYRKTWK